MTKAQHLFSRRLCHRHARVSLLLPCLLPLLILVFSWPLALAGGNVEGKQKSSFVLAQAQAQEQVPEEVSWKGRRTIVRDGQALGPGLGLSWLRACLSNVYAVARCQDHDKSFNFCVNEKGRRAEFGDCRTKHSSGSRTRRLVVALKGTELCNKTPFYDTVKLMLLGSVVPEALKHHHAAAAASMVAEEEGGGGEVGQGQKSAVWSSCYVPVSPFKDFNATIQLQSKGHTLCIITTESSFSPLRALLISAGFLLIVSSPMLSKSLSFRVGVGAVFAVVIGVVWGVYYCARRPKWTALSSVLVAIAALNQSWWRSFLSESNLSKLVILYCVLSACGGAAISYYFDTALSSGKALSIISTGFQATGCIFIYFNSQSVVVSAVLISVAFTVHLLKIDILAKTLLGVAKGRIRGDLSGTTTKKFNNEAAEDGEGCGVAPVNGSQELKAKALSANEQQVYATPARTATEKKNQKKKNRPFSPTLHKSGHNTEATKSPRSGLASPFTPIQSPPPTPSSPPWVTEGMLMNEETRRLIHVGKGTYKKLVKDGWVVNNEVGVISPPTKTGRVE